MYTLEEGRVVARIQLHMRKEKHCRWQKKRLIKNILFATFLHRIGVRIEQEMSQKDEDSAEIYCLDIFTVFSL